MQEFNSLTPEVAQQLEAVVGKRFYMGERIREDYTHDEMPIYGKYSPEAVCEVETTEEVSAIMKICNDNRIPVTARGAGTSLTGASVPTHGGVIVCTERMNKILGYDLDNMAVRVQPGVLLQDLAADADTHGLMYPPDPGSKTSTVGGNVATNAGGMRAVKYGVTRDYVLALTVVLANGEVMNLGKTVSKTSTGYSLLHLMIGSEGTLGIITEMTLRLIPAPKMNVSVVLPFFNMEACIATVPKIKMANLDPQSIEFMGADIVESSSSFSGKKIFPTVVNKNEVGASILVTFVGENEDELYEKMEKLDEIGQANGAIDTLVVDTPTLKKEVWAARSAFLTAIEADTKYMDEIDVVVPVDKIASYLMFIHKVGEEVGLTVRNFGHAGDGNLHIYACANDLEFDEFWRRNKALMARCYTECARIGGQLSGEHGIGHAKSEYLEESVGTVAYGMMKAIKSVFDPNGILNPGKVLN